MMKDLFAPVKPVLICHVCYRSSIDFPSLTRMNRQRIDCGCFGLINQVERILYFWIGYV